MFKLNLLGIKNILSKVSKVVGFYNHSNVGY